MSEFPSPPPPLLHFHPLFSSLPACPALPELNDGTAQRHIGAAVGGGLVYYVLRANT